jgi:hypothetical protein
MQFPCAVHKDHYDNVRIATDATELEAYRADGWITSDEWYQQVLGSTAETPRRKPKSEDA